VNDASGEAYIGPVLSILERRVAPGAVQCVSLGPSENFRARRWWSPLHPRHPDAAPPIEAFAPLQRLAPSRAIWAQRHAFRRALWASADLRRAAVIHGCDCWPLIREELAGIALLQWPWSARVMDEAAAALDVLRPQVALTYAEAGGWGRALMMECRRRRIPTAGLQHGFIYRHWLNYLHEADEMAPDPGHPADLGFPRPLLTLLFDADARRHLTEAGAFPPDSLRVTGSPRLDDLVRTAAVMTEADVARALALTGASSSDVLVLVATKHKEARRFLPPLVDAAAQLGRVRLAIKAHPAETPDVYASLAYGQPHVSVLPADAPLSPLLCAARALVTVNSTVALDAAVLGVPALVLGLPNNLAPFVDAGVMAGATPEDLPRQLRRILYDEEFRQQLASVRREFLARLEIAPDGRAAERAADAVLELVHTAPARVNAC
jgi:hypothetical protein